MTHMVVTRWYRSPELLFGARSYTAAVDLWACGCIFAELMLRLPYMAGETDFDQLSIIFRALGTPTEDEWPGFKLLNDYVDFKPQSKPDMRALFTAAPASAIDLLQKCLIFDPRKRISALDALKHPYFHTAPLPTHPAKLPKPTAELAPRPLAPEELNGKNGANGPGVQDPIVNRKRKSSATDLEPAEEIARSKITLKVARKLTFE